MKTNTKKALAMAGAVILAGSAGAIAGALLSPVTVTEVVYEPIEVVKTINVPVEVVKEVEKIVTVDKVVSVEDTSFVSVVCDRLMYDDILECKEEVKAEDVAIKLAVEEIKAAFADFLEDEEIVADEDEVSIVNIYDEFEDIDVIKSNFNKDSYEFGIKVKINDDGDRKYVIFNVEVEDGDASIVSAEEDI